MIALPAPREISTPPTPFRYPKAAQPTHGGVFTLPTWIRMVYLRCTARTPLPGGASRAPWRMSPSPRGATCAASCCQACAGHRRDRSSLVHTLKHQATPRATGRRVGDGASRWCQSCCPGRALAPCHHPLPFHHPCHRSQGRLVRRAGSPQPWQITHDTLAVGSRFFSRLCGL